MPAEYLGFAAAYCCTTFFDTNGLQGLLESEWGRMIPEHLAFISWLECYESHAFLTNILESNSLAPFPRNDEVRSRAVDSHWQKLEDDAENLYDLRNFENLNGRMQSFAKHHCRKLNLEAEEPEYVVSAFIPKQGMWQRDFRFEQNR